MTPKEAIKMGALALFEKSMEKKLELYLWEKRQMVFFPLNYAEEHT